MRVETAAIELETSFERGMMDLTDRVAHVLAEHDVRDGLVTLVPGSPCCGILLVDGTPGIVKGVGCLLETMGVLPVESASLDIESSRPAFEALLAGATCSVPVAGGRPVLGGRRIFLLECAGPGFRRIVVHILATSAIDHTVLEREGRPNIKAEDVV